MRSEPSLSFRGALTILDHYEPSVIGKLDKLLGGVILGAGAAAGLAAVAPPLAPLAAFAAIWGWTEQKNEAIGLLRQVVASVSRKVNGTAGVERRELIAVAHTTIAAAAFFEAFREHVGKDIDRKIALTEEEKRNLIERQDKRFRSGGVDCFYNHTVPAPSSSCGFEENIRHIDQWYDILSEYLHSFLSGLAVTERAQLEWENICGLAVERYRSHYLKLAATVPEFFVWAMIGEHAATRSAITDLRSDFASALDASGGALARVEALLALQARTSAERGDQCVALEKANRGVLALPIVPADAERYGTQVIFPPIEQIYVNPRYRIVTADQGSRPADEAWWDERPAQNAIDLTLAAHAMASDAAKLPLLLLGHPGAGKSLLTKVLAARLAGSGYTVVRVPLRQVGANAPIIDQIRQALFLTTNGRVEWAPLCEQSRGRVRVVLLDGLDELLQASSSDRSGYLQEVMEFQRIEADQGQPVIVVVTSRTVVADRVDIPYGTPIIRLDFFNDDDIEEWLGIWRSANTSLISSGTVRELTPSAARRQAELARQPLMLLMLALYSADPDFPALDEDLSTADLYERLLDNFARREVAKKATGRLSAAELDDRVRDQLDRLSIAALAMFNRGRQDITEAELGQDLMVLDPAAQTGGLASPRPEEAGQRLIAEFFFVHAAEAHQLSDRSAHRAGGRQTPLRSYEFLHATFAEYLVASRVMNELIDVAELALGGRRGPREPDDDLLFALLSHQPLVVRQTTLSFANEIAAHLAADERQRVLDVLGLLIKAHRYRHDSGRYAAYRPVALDRIRELATYSANLITLRVALEPGHALVPLTAILPESSSMISQWQSIVASWRSGLDADGQQAIANSLYQYKQSLRFGGTPIGFDMGELLDTLFALLAGDTRQAENLRYGMALCDGSYYRINDDSDNWSAAQGSWLIPYIIGWDDSSFMREPPPVGTPETEIQGVAQLVMQLLRSQSIDISHTSEVVEFLFSLPKVFEFDPHALAAAVMRYPELASKHSLLSDPATYGSAYPILCINGTARKIWPDEDPELTGDKLRAWLDDPDTSPDSLEGQIKEILSTLISFYIGIRTEYL